MLAEQKATQQAEPHAVSKFAAKVREMSRTSITLAREKLAALEKSGGSIEVQSEDTSVRNLRQAIKANCLSDLDDMFGQERYEILDFVIAPVDHEAENASYVFRVYAWARH